MEHRLYTRTNPNHGQIEISEYEIYPPDSTDGWGDRTEAGTVIWTAFTGESAGVDFDAAGDLDYSEDDLHRADAFFGLPIDGPLQEFVASTHARLISEGWVLLAQRTQPRTH